MSDSEDGGAAFPCTRNRYGDAVEGMSLRDYLAAQVMVGLGTWSPGNLPIDLGNGTALRLRAAFAYEQADAMLQARKRER